MELNYDDMLNKMNLKYFNGTFYKHPPAEPQIPQTLTKKDYNRFIYLKRMERAENNRRQIEKRKLLISAANGNLIQINTPNTFFKLNLPSH